MEYLIKKEVYHKGDVSEYYTAKIRYDDMNFNITYDCKTENLIIHEWYKIDSCQIYKLTEHLKRHFKNKTKKVLKEKEE